MAYSRKTTAQYYDCDCNNRLKLSAATRYMQQTSSEQLAVIDMSVEKLFAEGFVFLLSKTNARVHRMPLCSEELVIATTPVETRGPRFVREFTIESPSGERLISALTLWLLVDPGTHRILRPQAFPYPLPFTPSILDGAIEDTKILKAQEYRNPPLEVPVLYSYIDVNGHVNNSYYTDFSLNALPYDLVTSRELDTFAVNFTAEARPGDTIHICSEKISPDSYLMSGKNGSAACFEAMATFLPSKNI